MSVTISGLYSRDYWGKIVLDDTTPVNAICSVAEAKTHLRITSSDDDTYIQALCFAASRMAEAYCDRKFMAQNYEMRWDVMPFTDTLYVLGVGSITGGNGTGSPVLKYYDMDNSLQTFSDANYTTQFDTIAPRITLKTNSNWPDTYDRPGAVQLLFAAGTEPVPEPVKQGVLMIVGHLYENRQDVTDRIGYEMPKASSYLFDPYVIRLF